MTGFGGTTQVAAAESETVLDQTIRVRFDASRARDMPWEFRAVEPHMDVRIGETGLAFYEAHNPTDRPIAGTASFNVAPFETGPYFVKIACFCFELQVLQPGETVLMPVTFFVAPRDRGRSRNGRHPRHHPVLHVPRLGHARRLRRARGIRARGGQLTTHREDRTHGPRET